MERGLTASDWVERLGLLPHPEGGFYRETYRSPLDLPAGAVGIGGGGTRSAGTAIYFLVTEQAPSRFHRLRADEIWHHYDGGVLEIVCIGADGSLATRLLGRPVDGQAEPQCCVPAGTWFAARMRPGQAYALCGCTMAPGFDFEDFELGETASLLAQFPQHRDWIALLG